MRIDAKREVDWIIGHLETVVPCSECRLHIEEYRRSVGLPASLEDVAKWIWTFHQAVNTRLGKNGVEFSENIGSEKDLRNLWMNYTTEILQAVQMGQLPGIGIKVFKQHLFLWKGFCGF